MTKSAENAATDPFQIRFFRSVATVEYGHVRKASLIFQCSVSEKLPPPLWREAPPLNVRDHEGDLTAARGGRFKG